MSEYTIKYIISKVIDNANDALQEFKENTGDIFYQGKKLAYYEILDSIKNELIVENVNLSEFGLDIDLEKEFA